MSEKINVKIINERWASDNGSFYVYSGLHDNREIGITTPGFELRPGRTTLVGNWTEYRGQPSFKADYEEFDKNSYDAKYNLLCSITGIKDKTAKRILDNIPDNNIEIFYEEEAPKIKGIGPKTIEKIHQGLKFFRDNAVLKELISLLGNYLSSNKIHNLHKYMTKEKIKIEEFRHDPYQILIEELGFKFKSADLLAQKKLNCDPELESRINYLGEYATKNILLKSGNTYTDYNSFSEAMSVHDINVNEYNDLFESDNSKIHIDENIVQLKNIHNAEIEIPKQLNDFMDLNTLVTHGEMRQLEEYIGDYEKKNEIKLHEVQKEAVINSITKHALIICGGAGSGKSTIIKCIMYVLNRLNNSVLCLAPTGKASRRITEVTENLAYTCHRFYLTEFNNEFNDKTVPWITYNDCTLIIDEFSMVDTLLFHNVLQAMEKSDNTFTRIILVGDPGQLPSVGAGKVMTDIIENKYIDVIKLTKTFRQGEDSNIINMANLVRNKNPLRPMNEKDFMIACPAESTDYILRCFKSLYDKYDDLDNLYDDFQMCTSTNGKCNLINTEIQKQITNTVLLRLGKHTLSFGLNDKVMCIQNDYDNDIYNGEFGRITSYSYRLKNNDFGEEVITDPNELQTFYLSHEFLNKRIKDIKFSVYYKGLNRTVEYDMDWVDINKFKPAFITTIHKLQGSEFKFVLCDLSDFNMITDSRLLYTAITRAKTKFVLVSKNMDLINKVALNNYSSKRKTLLFQHKVEN